MQLLNGVHRLAFVTADMDRLTSWPAQSEERRHGPDGRSAPYGGTGTLG